MREKLKLYYLCRFTQLSPLRLSGGKNDRTDNDLMLDSRGLPMIPGSALAGVLRSRLPREDADLLFGKNTVGNDMTESAVLVGDAALPAGAKVRFTHRDGVGLDERKIAIPKAKYDFETAECSVPYTAVIEWSGWSDDPALPLLDALLAGAAADGLAFGGRTTRGYGRMANEDKNGPDYCALENGKGRPVLPGTGWAGAFRHHMLAMLDEMGGTEQEKKAVNALFGYSGDGILKKRSVLTFDETEISGGQAYILTRNALDRFTAGTASKALYTSCVQQGGQGTLTIRLRKGALDASQQQLLGAALLDLDRGYLTVGGENSVGRGRAAVITLTLNGRPLQKENLLHALAEVAK